MISLIFLPEKACCCVFSSNCFPRRYSRNPWIQITSATHEDARRRVAAARTAVLEILKPCATPVHIITTDNSPGFVEYKKTAKEPGAGSFFLAYPCSSWERGLNENFNHVWRDGKSPDSRHTLYIIASVAKKRTCRRPVTVRPVGSARSGAETAPPASQTNHLRTNVHLTVKPVNPADTRQSKSVKKRNPGSAQ